MRTRNVLIIVLAFIGIASFVLVKGIIIPKQEEAQARYEEEQKDPVTHDFTSILKYEHKYMGNNGNLNMFNHLPLQEYDRYFQIDSENLIYEVHYETKASDIGLEKVEKAVIYNGTAALVLIDNLEAIQFIFSDVTYEVTKEALKNWYQVDWDSLKGPAVWKQEVQLQLTEQGYIEECLETAFTVKK